MLMTLSNDYIYDGATGRLFKADTETYAAVAAAIEAIARGELDPARMPHLAYQKVRSENHPPPETSRTGYPSKIVITITEQCNLRCTYCPYPIDPGREHHPQGTHFDAPTREKVLDFLVRTIGPQTSLSFYGGEPLYRFKDIRYLVEELSSARPDWAGFFSFTTNLTVMSRAIADWLVERRAVMVVSLDGPSHIHDGHRPDFRSGGSYARLVNNLKIIREKDIDYYRTYVAFNSVIATLEFDSYDKFFADNFGDAPLIRFAAASYHGRDEQEREAYQRIHRELEQWGLRKLDDLRSLEELQSSPLALDFVRKNILPVMARESLFEGSKKFTSCSPGDKMIINSNGSVGVCEKTETLNLGDIEGGVSKRYDAALEFSRLLENRCRYCFAASCCNVCYAMVWDGETMSRKLLDRYCGTFRDRTRTMLNAYVSLRERFPDFDRKIVQICNEGSQHLFDEE